MIEQHTASGSGSMVSSGADAKQWITAHYISITIWIKEQRFKRPLTSGESGQVITQNGGRDSRESYRQ